MKTTVQASLQKVTEFSNGKLNGLQDGETNNMWLCWWLLQREQTKAVNIYLFIKQPSMDLMEVI